jgi:flagellar biosynthetic protein FliR
MPNGLDVLSPDGAAVAALLLVRVTGIVWIAPVLSARSLPMAAKTALSVLFVLLLWPVALPHAGVEVTTVTVLSELLIGLSLGLAASIFIAAAESAGDMLAVQMGLSGANVLDPMSHTQLPVVGQLLGLFVTAMILAVGGHVAILQTLGASLDVLPLGGSIDVDEGILAVVGLGSTLLLLGLRFAAPVIAAMMIGNAALGVLARTVPQMNLLMVAFPVQIGIGLFVLAATLPLIAAPFADWPEAYGSIAEGLVGALLLDGRS